MNKPLIQIRNLSHGFDMDQVSGGNIKDLFTNIFHSKNKFVRSEILSDINLDFFPNEKVAIIGKNGAGKSTLLKCIARIYEDYEGSIEVNGSIVPLLEVGAGFHPELTGRENLNLNCAIYGLTATEIQMIAQKIINFSGIGNFIDIPVKKYSSGMYMRLAFSIATELNPEILILDESFSAGDADFNLAIKDKIATAVNESRLTVMISHDEDVLRRLSKRGIVLHNGSISFDGPIEEAIKHYNNLPKPNYSNRALAFNLKEIPVFKHRGLIQFQIILNVIVNFIGHSNPRSWMPANIYQYLKNLYRKFYYLMGDTASTYKYADAYRYIFLKEHQQKNTANIFELIPATKIDSVKFTNFIKGNAIESFVDSYDFNSIKCHSISNALVTGKSSFIFMKAEKIVLGPNKDIKKTRFSEDLRFRRIGDSFTLPETEPYKLALAMSILEGASSNFAHFLLVCLPQISMLKTTQYADIPILVDANTHINFYRLIYMIHPSANLIRVPLDVSVEVKNLIYITPISEFPFETDKTHNSCNFSSGGLKALLADFELADPRNIIKRPGMNKYFLKRGSYYRNILNENEVESALLKEGYLILNPSELSVQQQINIYREADIIISPSGATLANLIHCKKTAKIHILYSNSDLLDLSMWVNLSNATSKACILVHTFPARDRNYMHSDFTVNVEDLIACLE